MLFADLFFLYFFLPVCLILYFITNRIQFRNAVLIVFSLVFYAWGEPLWIILLLFSVAANYYFGLMIGRTAGKPAAKFWVAVSLIVSLGLLGVFKYTGFIVENLNAFLPFELPAPSFTLPIGISFYTFQIISYTLDCYWGKVKVQKSFAKFLMYVSMFPQLVAGPIVRYSVVEQEIDHRRTTAQDISEGITRIAVGLGKKVIIANNLSVIVSNFFPISDSGVFQDITGLSVFGTWYTVIIYAMQVYFDFSGYSDMAIGLGRIFGFHFDENFRYPFICKNITEFWQRWHISLGSFFRDYLLYVPIFGKRRQYLSLFLVWFCTGLWHGASWNFIIWGLYFGVFIFLERKIGNKRMKKIPLPMLHIYNKLVIVIGFGIFYFEDMGVLGQFFGNLVGANSNALFDNVSATSLANNFFLIAAAVMFCLPVIPKLREIFEKGRNSIVVSHAAVVVCNVALILVSSIMLVNATNNPFLYFRF